MQTTFYRILSLILIGLAASSAFAHGDVQCAKHAKEEWRPHTELLQKFLAQGWQVRRVEATQTCYEVYAKDVQGKRVEAFFDPKTLERVED